jgi:hypothetical protein
MTAISLIGFLKYAATGTDVIITVLAGGSTVATLTIPAGSTSAATSTMVSPALTIGTFMELDITQIGSGFPGQGLSVVLECTQP